MKKMVVYKIDWKGGPKGIFLENDQFLDPHPLPINFGHGSRKYQKVSENRSLGRTPKIVY